MATEYCCFPGRAPSDSATPALSELRHEEPLRGGGSLKLRLRCDRASPKRCGKSFLSNRDRKVTGAVRWPPLFLTREYETDHRTAGGRLYSVH
jgi:hypothetical protein